MESYTVCLEERNEIGSLYVAVSQSIQAKDFSAAYDYAERLQEMLGYESFYVAEN